MTRSRVQYLQHPLPLGGLACEVCPYGLSGRCEGAVTATAESFSIQDSSVIGCLDPVRQRDNFVDLRGWRPPKKHRAPHNKLWLPKFIPEMATGLRQFPKFSANTLFGVSLSTILRVEGDIKFKSPEALRRALRLPPDARLALIGTVIDFTIEWFWQKSEIQDAWRRLSALNFEFATSLTYSVWGKHPRFDQIFNQEKNFATHDFLLAN